MSDPVVQDWNVITFHKKKTAEEAAREGGITSVPKVVHTGPRDVDPNDEGAKPIPVATRSIGQQIAAARSEKKWTQKKLDQECNFPVNTTRDYENGKAVINHAQLNMIRRKLGCKIDTS